MAYFSTIILLRDINLICLDAPLIMIRSWLLRHIIYRRSFSFWVNLCAKLRKIVESNKYDSGINTKEK